MPHSLQALFTRSPCIPEVCHVRRPGAAVSRTWDASGYIASFVELVAPGWVRAR